MSDIKLGQQPTSDTRDAIHIAIVSVIAGTQLKPGAHVGLLPDGTAAMALSPIGIVDPFLTSSVPKGERFWLLLYQNTVTGMRHHWSHPAFNDKPHGAPSPSQVSESEQWLRDFAESVGLAYKTLMGAAEEFLASGEFYCFHGTSGNYVPDEFWPHYEKVTGKSIPTGNRESFFTCSY